MASPLLDFLKQFGATQSVKASAIAAGIQAITGSAPTVRQAQDDYGPYTEIVPTPEQAQILRTQLEAWLNSDPGDVRVDLSGVWWPVVLKKTWWIASGFAAVGFFTGRKS